MKMGTIASPWRYDPLAESAHGHPSIRRPSLWHYADGLALHLIRSQSAATTTHLPHGDQAILDSRKIEDYCLNPSHPRGRHKARVFREALGLQRSDAPWLREVLLEAARSAEVFQDGKDAWGTHWRLDANVGEGKSAVVRMIWIVRTGESVPRFVTCWVL